MFLAKNWKPILMVAFVIISEVIIDMFPELHHKSEFYDVTWGDVLYYFFAQIGYISLLPSLFLFNLCKNKESKGIYLGLVAWNIYEVLQEVNSLFKLNIEYIDKSNSKDGDILQVIFITFTVLLMFYGYKKWSIRSQ